MSDFAPGVLVGALIVFIVIMFIALGFSIKEREIEEEDCRAKYMDTIVKDVPTDCLQYLAD